ncbi:helix-turn-helix domain-containing protein [Brevundimonas naejangsanensis]|uniref:helix-turn-helix domain-containing protein n=1 Tax=Brevundimonas naejangsanensis TaxID=588932 RepID=UPI000EC27946|nr:helix-turn-helix transcriptional regulator [Brevundimonas naejangsanensis]HCW49888.1 LuxR family transcriptional regulator [Brevundimonas sp.]
MNSKVDRLTPREREILALVSQRLGDKEIAQKLGLSPRTVQNHLHRAYEKLGVSDRIQAARLLSNSYSEELFPLSPASFLPSDQGVLAGSERVEDGKTPWPVPFYGGYLRLGRWRHPRRIGGSILLLILGGALAWILLAAAAVSLIPPVLEMIQRLR